MRLFTPMKEWIDRQRTASRSSTVLRGLILLFGALLVLGGVVFLWAGMAGTLLAGAAIIACVLWAVARPDGIGPLCAFVLYGVWWWFAGWESAWWQAAICGLLALAFHQCCAWAAAAPLYSDWEPATRRWMVRRMAALVGVSALAMGVVAGASALPVPTPLAWSAAAVAVIVGLVSVLLVIRSTKADF